MAATAAQTPGKMPAKAEGALRTIREVSEELGVPPHVLRFWEQKFPQVSPLKRRGGRRYYRPEDVDQLKAVQKLLYEQGFTIKGAVQQLRKPGARPSSAAPAPVPAKTVDPSALAARRALRQVATKLQAVKQLLAEDA